MKHRFLKNPTPRLAVKVPIVWVLGGPGSGKGTQCGKIVAKYDFVHLSTGDLLRNEVASETQRGRELQHIMDRGELVPNDVVIELLKEAIVKNLQKAKGFLIDGYPREKHQGILFEQKIGPVTCILFFETSDETLAYRLRNRARKSFRSDDNVNIIQRRIKTFNAEKDLILDQYSAKVKKIDAEKSVDEVFADVQRHLDVLVD